MVKADPKKKTKTNTTFKDKSKRSKCIVCKKWLKVYEGNLCSCDKLLCLKHRYKSDHSCEEGLVIKKMPKIVPRKVDKI